MVIKTNKKAFNISAFPVIEVTKPQKEGKDNMFIGAGKRSEFKNTMEDVVNANKDIIYSVLNQPEKLVEYMAVKHIYGDGSSEPKKEGVGYNEFLPDKELFQSKYVPCDDKFAKTNVLARGMAFEIQMDIIKHLACSLKSSDIEILTNGRPAPQSSDMHHYFGENYAAYNSEVIINLIRDYLTAEEAVHYFAFVNKYNQALQCNKGVYDLRLDYNKLLIIVLQWLFQLQESLNSKKETKEPEMDKLFCIKFSTLDDAKSEEIIFSFSNDESKVLKVYEAMFEAYNNDEKVFDIETAAKNVWIGSDEYLQEACGYLFVKLK